MKSKVEKAANGHPTRVTVESVDPEEGFLLSGSGSCFLVGRGHGVWGAGGVGCRSGCSLGMGSVLLIVEYLVGGWNVVTAI